jgi:RimJ/RimL family protein N-acetyltransferase
MKHKTLEGEHVRLEPLTIEHLVDLEKNFEPKLFDYYPKPYSTAKEFVEENLEMQKSGTFLPFAIIHKGTSQAIGCTEFSGIDEKNRKLEIGGSWIKSSHQGSVANSEAKFLLLCHAFENLGFVRVQFTANALNAKSRAGIEGVGGKFEGILRNVMILPDGQLRDDAYYSIISSEWSETKSHIQQRIRRKLNYNKQTEIICQTSRLILRKILPSDFDGLFEVLGDAEVMRFSVRGPESHEGVHKFLEATAKRYERDGVAQWAVIEKETGKFIGECGISVQMIDGKKEYEIGYRFSRRFWGKGYATEAAIACRDYGIQSLGLTRLISIIESENNRSIRVAEKVGMELEKESNFHGIPVRIYSMKARS